MNLEMRRRPDNARKRGFLDNNSSNNLENSNNSSPPSNNGKSSVSPPEPSRYAKLATNKAYAVHDPGLEDLDRLVMFITESKQIQGRYYVRYLPGMMNSAGELTPCNYRPTFSFSPPPSPVSNTPPPSSARDFNNSYINRPSPFFKNTSNNTSLKNQKNNVVADVVDLTDEDEEHPGGLSKDPKGRTGPISGGPGGTSRKDNETVKKTGVGPSSSNSPLLPGYSNPRKQTARKSMKSPSEIRPNDIRELKKEEHSAGEEEEDMDEDDDDEEGLSTTEQRGPSSSSSAPRDKKEIFNDNIKNNSNHKEENEDLSQEKWDLLDGITVTVNPDFG